MDKVVKCELCRFVFDYPRNGNLYFIRGEEHAICNGCADRVAEMRRFTAQQLVPLDQQQRLIEARRTILWLEEREKNCLLLASVKCHDDKKGWLEDAAFYADAIKLILTGARSALESAAAFPVKRKTKNGKNKGFEQVLTAVADEQKPAIQEAVARPFLKWAGGKRSILPALIERLPEKFGTYYENFLGGAALFFGARPSPAYLSDVNFPLVLTYIAVRDDVERVITNLQGHASQHEKTYYLEMRKRLHVETDPTKIAALLIYLNKTCYNGLYRVNQSGGFNVPMGSYKDPAILDVDNLRACSKALQGIEIWQHEFSQVPIREGSFYYLDPPYYGTFSGYDGAGFGDKDHEELAGFCKALDAAKCYFMVSNSDTPFIRKLYAGFQIEQVEGARNVSCKGETRGKEKELIIRNYGRRESGHDGEPSGSVR